MAPPATESVSSNLSKLTVPQLKALCKERRITGYSKLTKAGLLQKLAESAQTAAAASTTPLQDHQATHKTPSSTVVSSGLHANEVQNPKGSPTTDEITQVTCQPARDRSDAPTLTISTDTTVTTTPLASELPGRLQNRPVTGTTSTQRTSGEKRLAHTDISVPSKRIRTSPTFATATNVGHENVVPKTLTPQPKHPQLQVVDHSVPKAPKVPAQRKRSLYGSTSNLARDTSLTTSGTKETGSATRVRLATEIPELSQNRTVASQKTSEPEAKRTAHTATPVPTIRGGGTSLSRTIGASHNLPTPKPALQQELLVDPSFFKVPEVPAPPKRSLHDHVATSKKQPTRTSNSSAVAPKIAGQTRFKPLKPKLMEPNQARSEPPRAPMSSVTPIGVDPALPFNVYTKPLPTLSHITFPPKASERKWVYRWAIILSAISPTDRGTCMVVSRTFRYAVYLSATHLLSKNYAGRRLDAVFEQHPKNMTNFWPYLRFRTSEVSGRRLAFKQSFLGRYTCSMGYDPLSEHLWTSPDDKKQVDLALRFVLTRMWFAVSIGAFGHDASRWSKSVIRDVREVIKGEIWQVISQCNDTGKCGSYYVLEATCEVIGRPSTSQEQHALGYGLRVDWSTWISQRSGAPLDAGPCSLLECVKWSNAEDYHLGISKVWLRRVQDQDENNVAKRTVAQKYILASVVANGISGQWMSTSAMAQEFAGLPDKNALGARSAGRSVNAMNMYLPAHHHIESVHFTTANGDALHAAVAVVQTPGREYYVLRDNGMQVGYEEEGIPDVWQQILGCDALGRVR
ncbi:hypothetical protein JVU11DRAFT_3584 [Chiua virens]|nr:hypothetical protein JVU11DRAFT_3584 [Chiua virens]